MYGYLAVRKQDTRSFSYITIYVDFGCLWLSPTFCVGMCHREIIPGHPSVSYGVYRYQHVVVHRSTTFFEPQNKWVRGTVWNVHPIAVFAVTGRRCAVIYFLSPLYVLTALSSRESGRWQRRSSAPETSGPSRPCPLAILISTHSSRDAFLCLQTEGLGLWVVTENTIFEHPPLSSASSCGLATCG